MPEDKKRPVGDDIDPDAESLRSPRPVSRGLGGAPVKYIAKHTVQTGETLGSIALKYYKNAGEKYYMAIYEANKDIIGDNPNRIGPGMILNIPEPPSV